MRLVVFSTNIIKKLEYLKEARSYKTKTTDHHQVI
jgi:hypothetical protein